MMARNILFTIAVLITLIGSNAFCKEDVYAKIGEPEGYTGSTFSRKYIGVPIDKSVAINQLLVSDVVCGPTAVLNAMKFGNSDIQSCYESIPGNDSWGKLSFIVNEYGLKPSNDCSDGLRMHKDGICSVDLLHFYNDILLDNEKTGVEGEYIFRFKDEPLKNLLKRLHGKLYRSLKKGVPVVTQIRSFGVKRNDVTDKMYWYGLSSHYITITKIPERLLDYEKGFIFEYIDPYGARVESGYIGIETKRAFVAKIGNGEKSKWIKGKSFLLVKAPSLDLKTSQQKWYNRTIMTLNYVIGYITTE